MSVLNSLPKIAPDFDAEAERSLYPVEILKQCETGLLLFGCGLKGRNDGIWFLEAGLETTCVDLVPKRIEGMHQHYPVTWRFVEADAFKFAYECPARSFDLVSVDPPTQLSERVLLQSARWRRIAKRYLVLGSQGKVLERHKDVTFPGFELTEIVQRNASSVWLVLERQ